MLSGMGGTHTGAQWQVNMNGGAVSTHLKVLVCLSADLILELQTLLDVCLLPQNSKHPIEEHFNILAPVSLHPFSRLH